MSIKVMSKVWDTDMRPPKGGETLEVVVRKMILLAMADYADDTGGGIWPSVATLAKKCCVSERTIRRHLAAMREDGWILIDGTKRVKHGEVNVYRINLDVDWRTPDTASPLTHSPRTPDTASVNPSSNPSERETRKRVITLSDTDVPPHLRNQSAPKKRKPFRKGKWKGYDPLPENRTASVKTYRRIFPKVKLDRREVKVIANWHDTLKLSRVLLDWRAMVIKKKWSPRNWVAIGERYDMMDSPIAEPANKQLPPQPVPIYN